MPTIADESSPVKFCGENVRVTPVPASSVDSGGSGLLEVTVKVPPADPTAVGVKVTLMVQDPPAGTELPQVFVCAQGAPAEIDTLEIETAVVPVLTKTAVWTGLVVPTGCATKERVCGTRRVT